VIEILSNLLGEIVEVTSYDYYGGDVTPHVRARGVVRAIYPTERSGAIVVIENSYNGEPYGALRGYDLTEGSVRVVRPCGTCGIWEHPDKLVRETPDPDWYEHAKCAEARKRAERDDG